MPEPIEAVNEVSRILRRGGRLLLTAPLGAFLHQEPHYFYGGFTPHWYRKFLPEAGLEVQSIEANGGFFGWFGQEGTRFSSMIDPRRTLHKGPITWIGLTVIWSITLPFLRGLLPLISEAMDRLSLEHVATVGYHVVAVKR